MSTTMAKMLRPHNSISHEKMRSAMEESPAKAGTVRTAENSAGTVSAVDWPSGVPGSG